MSVSFERVYDEMEKVMRRAQVTFSNSGGTVLKKKLNLRRLATKQPSKAQMGHKDDQMKMFLTIR